MRKQKIYIVTEFSRTCCDYDYVETFSTEAEAREFIKQHKNEYSGNLDIVVTEK